MVKPTETDFINAHLITDRILLRKLFEDLKNRPQSKYFKNIIIKNVNWDEKTLYPLNFPKEFLKKYPFDFEASFTTMGCNMLKCYKHKENHNHPTLINDSIYACSEACVAIYKEFNDYLREKFNIKVNKNNDDFPIETFSIYDKNKNKNFCGIQLTPLKTFSILPSSRWWNKDISVEDYVKKFKDTAPLQLRDLAGLVDAPPLTWNTAKQTAHFNSEYCRRFQKQYLPETDECFLRFHRKGLSFLFGHHFINMFPDIDEIIKNGSIPFKYLKDYIVGDGLNINEGYVEKRVSQAQLERNTYVNIPDKITENSHVVNNKKVASSASFSQKKTIIINLYIQIIEEIAKETGIEMSLTTLPSLSARLLKHYSSKFLEQMLLSSHSLPISIRLFSLTARLVINELTIKMAIKILTSISTAANVLFAITIITIIPDIILSYYNIGGFNNEITREQIDKRRKATLDNFLRANVEQYDNALNYMVIDNGDYVSPIITPEFVYYLCLINFLKHNPDKVIDISHNGLGSEEEREDIAQEYLKLLKVNSIGQTINYDDNNANDDTEFINSTIEKVKNDNKIQKMILKHDIDLYLLSIGMLLLILSIILYIFFPKLSCIFIYCSLLCFISWVFIFKPYFN